MTEMDTNSDNGIPAISSAGNGCDEGLNSESVAYWKRTLDERLMAMSGALCKMRFLL